MSAEYPRNQAVRSFLTNMTAGHRKVRALVLSGSRCEHLHSLKGSGNYSTDYKPHQIAFSLCFASLRLAEGEAWDSDPLTKVYPNGKSLSCAEGE